MEQSRPTRLIAKGKCRDGSDHLQVGIKVFELDVNIPAALVKELDLLPLAHAKESVIVHWHYECSYVDRWALKSAKTDDGSKVAIELQVNNGHRKFVQTNGAQAPLYANTLYDFLTGDVVTNFDYEWKYVTPR